MTDKTYKAAGKEVLRKGKHYADAIDEIASARIAELANDRIEDAGCDNGSHCCCECEVCCDCGETK